MANIIKDTTYFLETLVLDSQGDPITSLSVTYKVIRSSDNTLLNSGNMSHIGNGVYQSSYLFNAVGQYNILYETPTQYTNDIETVLVEEISNSELYDLIKRILGLSQENYRLTNQIYDSNNCLISAKISTYNSALDTQNQVNPIAEYTINATYDANKRLTDYKVTKN